MGWGDQRAVNEEGQPPEGADPGEPRWTVVAIDDDALVLRATVQALRHAGLTCHTATTGREGLELIQRLRPDLVLLDLVLKEEDGFEICRQIRQTWSPEALPVVVVTGKEDYASIQEAYQAGANDFLTKPLHWRHLPFRIRHILRANQAFKDLEASTRTLRSLFAAHPDPIFYVDRLEVVTLVHSGIHGESNAFRPPLGTLTELLPDALAEQVAAACQQALDQSTEVTTLELTHPFNGEARFWEARFMACGPERVLVMLRDISERKAFEQRIRHLAFHDALTGLRNRHALSSTLERLFQEYGRTEGMPPRGSAALLYLDLDNFKRINDTLGHALGDDLLREVARRIGEVLRPSDLLVRAETGEVESVARLGGDEFCVILKRLQDPMDAGKVAQRILEALRTPVQLDGHDLVVTPSVGIAVIPQDGRDSDTVLKNADRAMYAAKEAGRNRFCFFDASMGTRLRERFAMEEGIRRGLARGAFHVHFQPQIDARTGEVLGMEALLRWDDPEMGSIAPARFIPVAEETGLIVELGDFVFREALAFSRSLELENLPPIRVAVNLSSIQMLDPQLLDRIRHSIALTGANPRMLEVEVTESVLLESSEQALEALHEMKRMGITLALDDFGTGYSSLSYLHRFPFDLLKIDRSFVSNVATEDPGPSLTAAIIALARSLNMDLIAEGVEQIEQASFLLERGCHKAQGFLYGRPMTPEAFRAYYRQQLER